MAMTKNEAIAALAKARKPQPTLTDWEKGDTVGAGARQRIAHWARRMATSSFALLGRRFG